MFSMIDFCPEELWALQGSADHLSTLISEGKVKPINRDWLENEQKERAEHLRWIIGVLEKTKSNADADAFRGFNIGNVSVCFDIEENEILALYAACQIGRHLLQHDQKVIADVGKQKVEDLQPIVASLLTRFTNIGAAKYAMELEWVAEHNPKNKSSEAVAETPAPKKAADISGFIVEDGELKNDKEENAG